MMSLPLLSCGQKDKSTYYEAATYEYADITLPYRQLKMNQDKAGKSLLVIQLHGGTARGDDNKAQLEASAVDSVEMYLRVHQSKAIFLLPQCSKDRVWNESSRSVTTPMTKVLFHWLQDFMAANDVDANRVYVTGYSAGGSGSWRLLNDYPQSFAAACIAAATPLMVTAEKVKNVPVYAIAGSEDKIMDADAIESFVKSLVSLGDDAEFDLLEGKDHFGTCDTGFTKERLDWMFNHKRGQASGIHRVDAVADVPSRAYGLDGKCAPSVGQGLRIVRQPDGTYRKVLQ